MSPEDHAKLVNERAALQERLAAVESLAKNNRPGSHILAAEKNKILQRLQDIDTAVSFHFAAKDAEQPRAQL
jgi:hypothetical protein